MSESITEYDSEEDDAARRKRDEEIVDKYLTLLSEHFDAIQIFATRTLPDDTTNILSRGRGNWCARRGMVEDWRVQKNAETVRDVMRQADD